MIPRGHSLGPRLMRRLLQILALGLLVAAGSPVQGRATAQSARQPTCERLMKALESGDRKLLAPLFPTERKIRVTLHRIADMEGFTGSGPLVEAFARYLASRTDVHFERDTAEAEEKTDPLRIRGVLCSRAPGKARERVSLVFIFETIGAGKVVVEVREAG